MSIDNNLILCPWESSDDFADGWALRTRSVSLQAKSSRKLMSPVKNHCSAVMSDCVTNYESFESTEGIYPRMELLLIPRESFSDETIIDRINPIYEWSE